MHALSTSWGRCLYSFKYNQLDWSSNTTVIYKKVQRGLHLLRTLRSSRVSRVLHWTFYDTVVASAVRDAIVCWGSGVKPVGGKKPNNFYCTARIHFH